ncbi:MAG: hypothetical protein QGG08_00890 [Candidatus Poseidoniia archaeon]|nr:hypothetical protein [Candidatus Poseidoniia archaeon]
MSEPEYPVRVGDETFGPMPVSRLRADLERGELSHAAHLWDGSRWVPAAVLLALPSEGSVSEDDWSGERGHWAGVPEDERPPLPASRAWPTVDHPGRWLMLYGDVLVLDGGTATAWELLDQFAGRATTGGIPVDGLVNVTLAPVGGAEGGPVAIEACGIEGMYEVFTLRCRLSAADATELRRELERDEVRVVAG